ncbi:hypothetical protein ABEX38_14275 [Priestia megaterium]
MNFKNLTTGTYIIIGIITILILLVGVPAFVNYLMGVHTVKVYGDAPAWIGFLGTYIGSILSGAITLIGVLLTLKHSEKESKKAVVLAKAETRRAKLPTMIAHTEECIDIVYEFVEKIQEFEKVDISDLVKKPSERRNKFFTVDGDFLLTTTEKFVSLENEFHKNKKLIRNHMVQIDEYAYQCYRRFEEEFRELYEYRIEPIENELIEFQGHIVSKYMNEYGDIITNMEVRLNSIVLEREDLLRFESILRKLKTAENKYITDLNDIHFELDNRLNQILLRFSDEFSAK